MNSTLRTRLVSIAALFALVAAIFAFPADSDSERAPLHIWSSRRAAVSTLAWPEVYSALRSAVAAEQVFDEDPLRFPGSAEIRNSFFESIPSRSFFHWMLYGHIHRKRSDPDR